ncbi:hypothetical protein ACPYO6_14130 [Georgenia sp. Z1344]|uniref:hypothetical protein n=1 Tax=Georgenia sp. Z1344 TaxID=3416706 RepID=UPI003CE6C9E6
MTMPDAGHPSTPPHSRTAPARSAPATATASASASALDPGGSALAVPLLAVLIAAPIVPFVLMALWFIWPGHVELLQPLGFICPPGYEDVRAISTTTALADGGQGVSTSFVCLADNGAVLRPGLWPVLWKEAIGVGILLALLLLPIAARVNSPARRAATARRLAEHVMQERDRADDAGTTTAPDDDRHRPASHRPAGPPDSPSPSATASPATAKTTPDGAHPRPATARPSAPADRPWATPPDQDLWRRR